MPTETLVNKIRDLVKVGETNGRPWAIVRFKDFWDNGLASAGKYHLEKALQARLNEIGIDFEIDLSCMDTPNYVMFVTTKGLTLYVGRGEKWGDVQELFAAVKEVLDNN